LLYKSAQDSINASSACVRGFFYACDMGCGLSVEDIKQFFEHFGTMILPKIFTITAGGNILIAGLAMADVVNVFVSLTSFVLMIVVFAFTIRHKRRQAYLTELEITREQTAIAFNKANIQPRPTSWNMAKGEKQ
jgi:hypothetical protein